MANDFVNTITTKDGTTYDIKGGTKLYKHTLQLDITDEATEEIIIINNSSSPITSLSNIPNIINGQISDTSSPEYKYYSFMTIVVDPGMSIVFGTYSVDITFGYTLGTDTVTEL